MMSEPIEWAQGCEPVVLYRIPEHVDNDIIWTAILSKEPFRWSELMGAREDDGRIFTITFLRGADRSPEDATQLQGGAQRFYPEYRSDSGKVLVSYKSKEGIGKVFGSSDEIKFEDLEAMVGMLPCHEILKPVDWLAGALYASVWPMEIEERGGAVDALSAICKNDFEMHENDGFESSQEVNDGCALWKQQSEEQLDGRSPSEEHAMDSRDSSGKVDNGSEERKQEKGERRCGTSEEYTGNPPTTSV